MSFLGFPEKMFTKLVAIVLLHYPTNNYARSILTINICTFSYYLPLVYHICLSKLPILPDYNYYAAYVCLLKYTLTNNNVLFKVKLTIVKQNITYFIIQKTKE